MPVSPVNTKDNGIFEVSYFLWTLSVKLYQEYL